MRSIIPFLALLTLLTSCSSRARRARAADPTEDDPPLTLPIWIEDDPRMPKEDVLRGCQEWQAKGITCVEVAREKDGKVRVYAVDEDCVEKDERGVTTRTVLARAFYGGRIKMMSRCMTKTADGLFNRHQLAGVVTHEIGHQLGIWDHVPRSCEGEGVLTHTPTGTKICGIAVMNKSYNRNVVSVTEIDAMAYDARDPKWSLKIGHTQDIPICEYHVDPAP